MVARMRRNLRPPKEHPLRSSSAASSFEARRLQLTSHFTTVTPPTLARFSVADTQNARICSHQAVSTPATSHSSLHSAHHSSTCPTARHDAAMPCLIGGVDHSEPLQTTRSAEALPTSTQVVLGSLAMDRYIRAMLCHQALALKYMWMCQRPAYNA